MKKIFQMGLSALALTMLVACGGGTSSSSHATGHSSSQSSSHATGLSSSESSHATGLSSSEESHATGLSSDDSHGTGLISSDDSHDTGLSSSEESHDTGLSSSEESHDTGLSSSEESHDTGLSSSEESHDTGLSSSEESHDTGLSSDESSSEEIPAVSYYVVGNFNGWGSAVGNPDYLMEWDDFYETYWLEGINLKAGWTLKVTDGTNWYPADNISVEENGLYDIEFDPDGNSVDLHWIDEYQGELGDVTYYVVGDAIGWNTRDESNMLSYDAGTELYVKHDMELTAGEKIKIVDSENSWYPDSAPNYEVDEDGIYDLYFDPEGDLEIGYCGYFYFVQAD